jgi:hypothetical protein
MTCGEKKAKMDESLRRLLSLGDSLSLVVKNLLHGNLKSADFFIQDVEEKMHEWDRAAWEVRERMHK